MLFRSCCRRTVGLFTSGFLHNSFEGFATLQEACAEWNMALANGTWGPLHLQPRPPQPPRLEPIDFTSINRPHVYNRSICQLHEMIFIFSIPAHPSFENAPQSTNSKGDSQPKFSRASQQHASTPAPMSMKQEVSGGTHTPQISSPSTPHCKVCLNLAPVIHVDSGVTLYRFHPHQLHIARYTLSQLHWHLSLP